MPIATSAASRTALRRAGLAPAPPTLVPTASPYLSSLQAILGGASNGTATGTYNIEVQNQNDADRDAQSKQAQAEQNTRLQLARLTHPPKVPGGAVDPSKAKASFLAAEPAELQRIVGLPPSLQPFVLRSHIAAGSALGIDMSGLKVPGDPLSPAASPSPPPINAMPPAMPQSFMDYKPQAGTMPLPALPNPSNPYSSAASTAPPDVPQGGTVPFFTKTPPVRAAPAPKIMTPAQLLDMRNKAQGYVSTLPPSAQAGYLAGTNPLLIQGGAQPLTVPGTKIGDRSRNYGKSPAEVAALSRLRGQLSASPTATGTFEGKTYSAATLDKAFPVGTAPLLAPSYSPDVKTQSGITYKGVQASLAQKNYGLRQSSFASGAEYRKTLLGLRQQEFTLRKQNYSNEEAHRKVMEGVAQGRATGKAGGAGGTTTAADRAYTQRLQRMTALTQPTKDPQTGEMTSKSLAHQGGAGYSEYMRLKKLNTEYEAQQGGVASRPSGHYKGKTDAELVQLYHHQKTGGR